MIYPPAGDPEPTPALRIRFPIHLLVAVLSGSIACTSILRCQEEAVPATGTAVIQELNRILEDPILDPSFIGVKVVRMETGEVVYERNSEKLFHPASNMKLLTTAAAINRLPADFKFRTDLYCDDRISDSVLEGNLYIRGGGDPLIEVRDLDSMAGIVLASGIRRIEGSITGDLTYFDTLRWGKGWMWDDEPEPEEAFLGPLTLHRNSVTLTIRPGGRKGDTVFYTMDPPSGSFTVVNRAVTTSQGGPHTLAVVRESGNNMIRIDGALPAGSPEREKTVSIHDPSRVFLETLKERLALRGVENSHPVALDSVRGSVRIGTIEHSLDSVINRINKESDNLDAEHLLKVLGVVSRGRPGSAENGLRVLGKYLSSIGQDPASLILADGSGVSWYNAVTPDLIVGVLRDQYARMNRFRSFLRSLPVGGYDGTLMNRMGESAARGRVFAKTGTLTGVQTISGYLCTDNHELLGFSIMINHFPGKAATLRGIQDRLLEELVLLPASGGEKR